MKYSETILARIFNYSSCCYALKEPPEFFILEHDSQRIFQFYKDHHYGSPTHPLISQMTPDPEDIRLTEKYFAQITEDISDMNLAYLLTAEVLSKVLSYRNLKKGHQIKIPQKTHKSLELIEYRVDVVLNLWQDIRCFGLVPIEKAVAPPLLLFPGTDFSLLTKRGRASMLNDLDPSGPGRSLFLHARQQIRHWLETVCQDHLACLFGHSLGGILASYVLIMEHKFIHKSCKSFIFNHPGIELDMFQRWMEIDKNKQPDFIGFVSRGDIVSKYGYLFGNTYELALGSPLQPITAHTNLFFAHPVCHLSKVDINMENNSKSRKQYSKLYKKTSSLFYHIGLKYFFPDHQS